VKIGTRKMESADTEWIRSAYGDLPFLELDTELAKLNTRPVTLSHLPEVTVSVVCGL
jgi:hypothetical protein